MPKQMEQQFASLPIHLTLFSFHQLVGYAARAAVIWRSENVKN
jgi:hypothetical protein